MQLWRARWGRCTAPCTAAPTRRCCACCRCGAVQRGGFQPAFSLPPLPPHTHTSACRPACGLIVGLMLPPPPPHSHPCIHPPCPTHPPTAPTMPLLLQRIGHVDNVASFLEGVKNRKERMFGFGHRCVWARLQLLAVLCDADCMMRPLTSAGCLSEQTRSAFCQQSLPDLCPSPCPPPRPCRCPLPPPVAPAGSTRTTTPAPPSSARWRRRCSRSRGATP